MNKYLYMSDSHDSLLSSCNKVYIIEASNPDEAIQIAVRKSFKNDELFIEHLKETACNCGFAENFWLQTDEDKDYFSKNGKTLISFKEFKKRVKKYFGTNFEAAGDYLEYYLMKCIGNENEANRFFENFIKNAEDLLIELYLKYTDPLVIDLSKIPKL